MAISSSPGPRSGIHRGGIKLRRFGINWTKIWPGLLSQCFPCWFVLHSDSELVKSSFHLNYELLVSLCRSSLERVQLVANWFKQCWQFSVLQFKTLCCWELKRDKLTLLRSMADLLDCWHQPLRKHRILTASTTKWLNTKKRVWDVRQQRSVTLQTRWWERVQI